MAYRRTVSTTRVFVGRLSGRGVFDPSGERIGKVRDVLVVFRASAAPRVVGLIIEIPGKRRVFLPISRVTSIAAGQVITTGLINVRRFKQRGGETRLIAELIGSQVHLSDGSPGSIADTAIERTASGEWIVTQLFVRSPRPGGPFARSASRSVEWHDVRWPTNAAAPSAELLVQTLVDLRPADLADALLELSPTRTIEVIAELPDARVADALEEMVPADQLRILAGLPSERSAEVLDRMEPDDAADLIAELPAARGEELLELMEPQEADEVRRLLEYESDTAGGLMNPTPIVLAAEASVAEGLAYIRRREVAPAMGSAVFITHPPYETPTGTYIGMAHFQRMLRFAPHESLSAVIDDDIEAVSVHASAAEVARRLASYDLVAIPVVDDHERLVGVITIDDVLDHLLPDDWREA